MNKLLEMLPSMIILMHAGFLTSSITTEWKHSPFDSGGQIAFSIWVVVWLFLIKTDIKPSLYLTLASGLSLTLGIVTDLNVMVHLALIIAALQFMPRGAHSLAHLICGIAWLPAFGYAIAMAGVNEEHAAAVRIAVASLSVVPLVIFTASRRLELRYG